MASFFRARCGAAHPAGYLCDLYRWHKGPHCHTIWHGKGHTSSTLVKWEGLSTRTIPHR